MPRYRRPPLTVEDIWRDGPPVRLRDLVAVTGLSDDTIYQDIAAGSLKASKRSPLRSSPWLVQRDDARAWLDQMGTRPSQALVRSRTLPIFQPTPFRTPQAFLQHVAELMGLGDIVRNAVMTANRVTGGEGGLQTTVQHAAWTGMDSYAKPSFASAVKRSALVEMTGNRGRPVLVRGAGGEDIVVRASVTFLEAITPNSASGRSGPIDPRDRITLPDGTTGPIVNISGPIDPNTDAPFFYEVLLG